MRTDTYTVDDIHCRGCEGTIRALVGDTVGVHTVEPDNRTNQVTISYDETVVDDTTLRAVLANIGFPAR